jgi:hypothetical protein
VASLRQTWARVTGAPDRGHPHTISLKLRDVSQLFNSMDPSPFIEKNLDDDAEEFIVSWPQEFSRNVPVKLRVHLDQWPTEDPKELIRTAVHNHFTHLAQITDLEFKRLLKQGRTSLFIGPLFLAACLFLSKMLVGHDVGRGPPSYERALRLRVGSLCGDRCRSIFTIGGLCCDGVGSMSS